MVRASNVCLRALGWELVHVVNCYTLFQIELGSIRLYHSFIDLILSVYNTHTSRPNINNLTSIWINVVNYSHVIFSSLSISVLAGWSDSWFRFWFLFRVSEYWTKEWNLNRMIRERERKKKTHRETWIHCNCFGISLDLCQYQTLYDIVIAHTNEAKIVWNEWNDSSSIKTMIYFFHSLSPLFLGIIDVSLFENVSRSQTIH